MTYRGALALNTHTMSALREGIYFIGEGGGEGKTVEKLQWKNSSTGKPWKNIEQRSPTAHQRLNMWYGMRYFVQPEVAKILLFWEIANPSLIPPPLPSPIQVEWSITSLWHRHRSVDNLTKIEEFVTRMELRLNVVFSVNTYFVY